MDLKLEKDSSFYIFDPAFEYAKQGRGRWTINHSDTLILNFNNIHSGTYDINLQDYFAGQHLTFYITKSGKLKLYKLILKKVK